jgi:hypothetical protein
MTHLITAQERDLTDAALQRLKSWAQDTAARCSADGLDWESSQSILMTCVVHALQVFNPVNIRQEKPAMKLRKTYAGLRFNSAWMSFV